MASAQNRTSSCVVVLMHDSRPGAVAAFKKLEAELKAEYDIFVLFDSTAGAAPPPLAAIHMHALDMKHTANYPSKRGDSFWPENIDLPVLEFYLDNPSYENVWVVEYDVRYLGNWCNLMSAFRLSSSDLITSTIFDYAFRPTWPHWEALTSGAEVVPLHMRTRALLPIYRISRRALQALDACYRSGWSGHYEVVIPTALKTRGLSLEDLGGNGRYTLPLNINRFYLNEPQTPGLGPGTLVHTDASLLPRISQGLLQHPVKG